MSTLLSPVLSILIVNWNTRDLLRACLASIQALPEDISREVIVVDNASRDESAAMVKNEFPSVHLINSGGNLGYAAGNNLAFAAANGDYLLTLNPDTEFIDDSIRTGIALLERHSDVGVLGAKQIAVDGSVQQSVRGFPTIIGIMGDLTGWGRRHPGTWWDSYRLSGFDYEKEQQAPQPMGTFLLFKREALAAIGDPKAPFATEFPIFFNEVDLLLRLYRAGWHCLYSPDVHIKHHGGESTKQVRKSMIWESHRSLVRFLWKHRRTWWDSVTIPIVGAAVYAGAFIRARGYDKGFRP